MPPVRGYERLAHLVKTRSYRFAKLFIDELEHPVHAVSDVDFINFVNLLKRALLKLDNKFLIHREDGDFEVGMGKFGYCSHGCFRWIWLSTPSVTTAAAVRRRYAQIWVNPWKSRFFARSRRKCISAGARPDFLCEGRFRCPCRNPPGRRVDNPLFYNNTA